MVACPVSDAIAIHKIFAVFSPTIRLCSCPLRCIIIGKCQRQKCKLQSVTKARPSSEHLFAAIPVSRNLPATGGKLALGPSVPGLTVEQHVSWKNAMDRIKKLLEPS